jgi:hypothetical protein
MKLLQFLRCSVVLSAAALLSSCSTSPISRIDANRAAYESWPIEVQEAVLSQRVIVGMTPDQVRTSLGKPTEIVNRSVQAGDDEVWVYRKGGGGSSLLNNTNVSLGGSIGGIGVAGSPGSLGSQSSGEEEHEVVFRNGVVSRTDIP